MTELGKPFMHAPLWPVPLLIFGPMPKATLMCIFAMAAAQPDHK